MVPKLKKAKGYCSVCHKIRKLHDVDGRVHLHGPRATPCLGSRQLPSDALRSTTAFASAPLSNVSAEGTCTTGSDGYGPAQSHEIPPATSLERARTTQHPCLQRSLLRHIPKGARSGAGRLLTEIIEAILKDPQNVEKWRCLLAFGAGTLEVPMRGGRRHSLTLQVKRRVATFYDSWPNLEETIFSPPMDNVNQRKSPTFSSKQSLATAVAAKLEDGNITAAARLICSDEAPAMINEETFELLRQKHPVPPLDRPVIHRPNTTPLQTTEAEIQQMMRSFPMGSSGGPDGLRPQHVVELVGDPDAGPGLLRAMTALVNLLLAGTCPQELRPVLFGGTLFALRKKSGGLRPIAIGYTWRRLASKCANAYAIPRLTSFLSPKQLGVGIPGGCEAAVHATRRFLANTGPDSVVVKLDLSNAFNSLHRDSMLASVNNVIPELAAYCHLAYAEATCLRFGSFVILSQEGAQQGDPLGPLLFCLPLQPVLVQLESPLAFGYLDDLTLGGTPEVVAADVDLIEKGCSKLGLTLNRNKCELIAVDPEAITENILSQFVHVSPSTAKLLGAPLSSEEALTSTLDICTTDLGVALDKLPYIARQDALLILRCSLGSPRLMHILRSSPCHGHPRLEAYDELLRAGFERILNVSLTDEQWTQASLPIRMGGLGIRRVSSLALPAFLASAAGTLPIQSDILGTKSVDPDTAFDSSRSTWLQLAGVQDPTVMPGHKQSHWDRPLLNEALSTLEDSLQDTYDQARVKASQSPHASDWLYALPIAARGLRLDNETVRVAVGLRLGVAICEPHLCACGANVSARGAHGLSCSLGFGRQARHSNINDLIHRSLNRAGIPAIKEPSGLTRSDGKRPDGQTLIPWSGGRTLLWDATVIDTVATSYIQETAAAAGGAAEIAAARKHTKYKELEGRYTFVPIAVETFGPLNREGLDFLSETGSRLSTTTGDARETFFLFQSLSATIQRFNAVAFQGTMSRLSGINDQRPWSQDRSNHNANVE